MIPGVFLWLLRRCQRLLRPLQFTLRFDLLCLIPGRKKMSALVAKIYALYLSVEASTQKREIYEEYRGVLKTNYKVTVHEDTPRSALVMKVVLPKIDSKTAHLYGRALDLAKGYEVDPSDYVGFVKGLGGYEKIRKAYAKVLAADAGKMLPLQKYAANSATRAFVSGLEPVKYTSASI